MSARTYNDIAVLHRLLLTMVWIGPFSWFVVLNPLWPIDDGVLFQSLAQAFAIGLVGHMLINFVFEGRLPASHKSIIGRILRYFVFVAVMLKLVAWSGALSALFPNYS